MKIDGLPVVDGVRPIILTIEAKDIKVARPTDPEACAAAKACVRQLHCEAARVHLSCIYILTKGKWYRYHTPGSLRSEIIGFDRRKSFMPGDYILKTFHPTIRARRGRQAGSKKGQTTPRGTHKPRIPNHFVQGVRGRMNEFTFSNSK